MKWSNLKKNKCPKCEKNLYGAGVEDTGQMIIHPCGFKISYRRLGEIVNSQVNSDLERKWDQELEGGEING